MTQGQADERDLDALRREVERAAQLPVGERPAAFEAINATLVQELAHLDEL